MKFCSTVIPRRLVCLLLLASAFQAHGNTFPDRPLRIVVPSAAGGSPDAMMRLLASELSRSLGQPITVENKPGDSGQIGMKEGLSAAADGYTLTYGNVGTLAINKALYKTLNYDPEKGVTPLALVAFTQNALVVVESSRFKSLRDVLAFARANPGQLTVAYFLMDQGDVDRIMQHPLAMIGSDGLPHDHRPHPRLWGSFPRVLGHYVRERGILQLEQAVHKMTGLSARRFGLQRRGLIRPGFAADLVAFDPQTIQDEATFEVPVRVSSGIRGVWVNGVATWLDGSSTGARPGRTLRRQNG